MKEKQINKRDIKRCIKFIFHFLFITYLIISCKSNNSNNAKKQEIVSPSYLYLDSISIYPHDTSAFTQGLQYYERKLFESTGDYENSSIRIVNYKTGEIIKKESMGSAKIFGEGLTIFKNEVFQLTWQNHLVYVYELNNLRQIKRIGNWPREGWGITNDGQNLIISDGSSFLFFVDANSFKINKMIQVTNNNQEVQKLNELEYINGYIYANVFEQNIILKIDPSTGVVTGIIDCSDIIIKNNLIFYLNPEKVLNGIAWDNAEERIIITGKLWPVLITGKLRQK